MLRHISEGACYYQARIAYYAYTQVTRTDRLVTVADLHHPVERLRLTKA